MSVSNEWHWWVLGALVSAGVLTYAVFEYLKWLERTQVYKLPNGLRFVAHGFQIEVNRTGKKIGIKSARGHYKKAQAETAAALEKSGELKVSLLAMGLRTQVAPMLTTSGQTASTQCSIHFDGTEEKVTVIIPFVPNKVGEAFNEFWRQIAVWIEKMEERRAKEEAAKASAEAMALEVAKQAEAGVDETGATAELTADAQVAQWREVAGFKGTSSDIALDENGKIVWFIDLDPTGRVILHSDKRTAIANLLGAQLVSLGGELEVTVREEFWTEAEPETRSFRLLKGRSPDERRAWKERMEILRGQLQADAKPGR